MDASSHACRIDAGSLFGVFTGEARSTDALRPSMRVTAGFAATLGFASSFTGTRSSITTTSFSTSAASSSLMRRRFAEPPDTPGPSSLASPSASESTMRRLALFFAGERGAGSSSSSASSVGSCLGCLAGFLEDSGCAERREVFSLEALDAGLATYLDAGLDAGLDASLDVVGVLDKTWEVRLEGGRAFEILRFAGWFSSGCDGTFVSWDDTEGWLKLGPASVTDDSTVRHILSYKNLNMTYR